ncbi:MAG TPA: protein kinase [Longimicrobium sp.]|jgi:tetratricopeptide (TPR) repeat protein|uniref:protein kinase domain-containing protein n=1 Tax=Longimicrobium sp. TaxID=2029185 RepID=UPI002EDA4EDB
MSGLAQFLVGHVLNERYRLDSVLGQGGFGVVFRAADLQRDREVAVKVMDPPRGMGPAETERMRQRFQREAAVAARLPMHPNLVPVLDVGSDARVDFLVMQLLRGESLRERLAREEPLGLRTALHVLRETARGVAAGHEIGLVHRDLKPANIFLEGDGPEPSVRVLDFGIAKVLDDEEDEETRTHLTMPGEWFGSEFYCAPEHLRREPVTRTADVFSLGVVAFEVLTRTRLFTREDQNRRRAGLPVPIPSLVARNPQVPRDVEWIVRRALLDDAGQRFANAGEMAAELHRAIASLRRAADHPVEAVETVAVPAQDRRAVSVEPGEATVAVAPLAQAGFFSFARRKVDVADDPLSAEIEKVRWRRMRTLAARAAVVAVLASGGVMGGIALAANREYEGAPAAPARVLTAVEENEEGLRRFRAGEYAVSLGHFRRAMEKAPGQAEYMNNHAYALLRAGRPQEAVTALQDVIAQHPEREVAYSNLAEAQLALADTAGAITTLNALLATNPSQGRRREAEIFLRRLGGDSWDTAEWDDVQQAETVDVEPDAGDPWTDAPVENLVPTMDTITHVTTTTRAESRASSSTIRRRTYSGGRWRDTIVFRAEPGETLRVGTP